MASSRALTIFSLSSWVALQPEPVRSQKGANLIKTSSPKVFHLEELIGRLVGDLALRLELVDVKAVARAG